VHRSIKKLTAKTERIGQLQFRNRPYLILRLFPHNLCRLHNYEKEAKARELLRVAGEEKDIGNSDPGKPGRVRLGASASHRKAPPALEAGGSHGVESNLPRFDSAAMSRDSNCQGARSLPLPSKAPPPGNWAGSCPI
jgi:hypothetical protein